MKILAIRGRNLASLEGEFSIDFTVEPLASAGIYAISGPTGAGKSTLLDAMCLALFARTPRTEQARESNVKLKEINAELLQGDTRFLLRRGTASGYAEVDFVALNGFRYRSRWSVARAREKVGGRLQQIRMTLYDLDRGKEEPGNLSDLKDRIEKLIGLTFDQFTRSVLLAQNDFSTFLKAEQGEKASLLEKLTGTEQYSAISRLIFAKNSEAREAYEKIQVRIQGVELLPDEEEASLRLLLKETELRLTQLEKAKAERQALEESLRSVEQQKQQKERQQQEAADRLAQAVAKQAAARQEYEKGLEALNVAEARSRSLQSELLQARKLDVQLEAESAMLRETESKWKESLRRKEEGEEKLQKAVQRRKQGEEEIGTLQNWREKYRSKERISEQLPTLLLYLDAASEARLNIDRAERSIASVRKQAEQLMADSERLTKQAERQQAAIRETEQEWARKTAELKEADVPVLEKELNDLRNEREHLLVEQARTDIRELRGRLEEGKPCPVCGSLHHPVLQAGTATASPDLYKKRIAGMTLRLQELTARITACNDCRKQLDLLQQQQLALHKSLTETENLRTQRTGQQKVLEGQLVHDEAVRREQSEHLAKSLRAANDLFGGDTWQAGWQKDPKGFRRTLADFARQWQERGERLLELQRRQSAWKAECDSLSSFLPGLQKQWEEARLLYEQRQTAFQSLQAERRKWLSGRPADEVENRQNRLIEELKERQNRLLAMQNEQAGIAGQSKGITEQIAKDLSLLTETWVARQEALATWTQAWQERSGGENLEELLLLANRRKTETAFRLRSQEENRKKVAGMQDELKHRREISDRWAQLNELAGSADGAKFRRIAQGYTLDVLLGYANVQLRNLTRRYRLERVPDTLALQVIDRDMCDEVRTVHSLSGGESFLVSLALALGLSSLSSNRMKVESLFIDEGFGSLDAETLRVAMDALESLRTQGRKIGVISHVQEMTERIPAQIRVNRAGNGRSFIEIVG